MIVTFLVCNGVNDVVERKGLAAVMTMAVVAGMRRLKCCRGNVQQFGD